MSKTINSMNTYCTEIIAQDPFTGELKKYGGPNVPGISFADAQDFCERNGLGYCKVIGQLVTEIPCKDGTYTPDFKDQIDYDNQNLN